MQRNENNLGYCGQEKVSRITRQVTCKMSCHFNPEPMLIVKVKDKIIEKESESDPIKYKTVREASDAQAMIEFLEKVDLKQIANL